MATRSIKNTDADVNIVRVVKESDLSIYTKLDPSDIGKWGIFDSRSAIVCESYKKASELSSSLNRCI